MILPPWIASLHSEPESVPPRAESIGGWQLCATLGTVVRRFEAGPESSNRFSSRRYNTFPSRTRCICSPASSRSPW
jgi:hypothetical protein